MQCEQTRMGFCHPLDDATVSVPFLPGLTGNQGLRGVLIDGRLDRAMHLLDEFRFIIEVAVFAFPVCNLHGRIGRDVPVCKFLQCRGPFFEIGQTDKLDSLFGTEKVKRGMNGRMEVKVEQEVLGQVSLGNVRVSVL